MKKFNSTQLKLIALLADGSCQSGSDLGNALNVSRTAIWKQTKQLAALGLPIQSIPQQGYHLAQPLILLNEQTIRDQLNKRNFNQAVYFHLFASLDSTNHFLKQLPNSLAIDVCCAETQTDGRGRFGRSWHSPFGENIYCSSRWHFDSDLSALSGLSLVVSLAIIATLNEFGIDEAARIKWPNDILWQNKKLCGCLIEISAESNSGADVVIGIGLNVNSATKDHPLPDKPWCSLYEMTGNYFDRNLLMACLITQLHKHIQRFVADGFPAFMAEWQPLDYLQDQLITVSHPTGPIVGKAAGVNESGQLILIDDKGIKHYLSSGDTSLQSIK